MSIQAIGQILPLGSLESITSVTEAGANTAGAVGGMPFTDILSGAMRDIETAQQVTELDARDLVMGGESDLHTIMINTALETTAIETAVELTSRVVSAYKEIMQMQI